MCIYFLVIVYLITFLSPTGENPVFDSRKRGFERKTERRGGTEESSGRQKSGKMCNTFAVIYIIHSITTLSVNS